MHASATLAERRFSFLRRKPRYCAVFEIILDDEDRRLIQAHQRLADLTVTSDPPTTLKDFLINSTVVVDAATRHKVELEAEDFGLIVEGIQLLITQQ